jgi:asparagine synthetase B (glutamine-hydrolysing)
MDIFNRKKVLKKTIKSRLPKSLFNKKKSGFNTPIGLWLVKNKRFKQMAYDLLSTNFMKNLFNYNEIIKIWNSHQEMKIDQTYKIFNLISLSQWVINNELENKL